MQPDTNFFWWYNENMIQWLKKGLILLTVISFSGILFLGPFFNHSTHISDGGCPFATNEQGMCPMMSLERVDYIATAVLKVFFNTIVVALPVVLVMVILYKLPFVRQRYVKNISLYQRLFSQGILNPKAP